MTQDPTDRQRKLDQLVAYHRIRSEMFEPEPMEVADEEDYGGCIFFFVVLLILEVLVLAGGGIQGWISGFFYAVSLLICVGLFLTLKDARKARKQQLVSLEQPFVREGASFGELMTGLNRKQVNEAETQEFNALLLAQLLLIIAHFLLFVLFFAAVENRAEESFEFLSFDVSISAVQWAIAIFGVLNGLQYSKLNKRDPDSDDY